ncbi:MAG: RNA polymerase sigma factor [Candidatus Cohnella colombiensis]|uniref:RNA polymerase sigma factor n=1 Tax=Candidatus Cohnella colombiensis TaxID=3121368 RepID=A0AA95EW13_9BACL|nr:MAG: RNA polymerase sigma factor [Cohnella sp.]
MDWKPILHQYSMHLTRNHWDAEDLTQDAWLKLNEAIRNSPERSITKAFLYRIVKNSWIDLQRKARMTTVPYAQSHEASSLDPLLSSRELLEQLAERLPPKMAVILLLMDVFDFTAKETAGFIGMKEAAAQVYIGRARRKLRELAQNPVLEKTLPNRSGQPVNFDALVDAFQRRDPDQIYKAYIGLNREGIRLTKLQASGSSLHFTFRDFDGNLFHIVSK